MASGSEGSRRKSWSSFHSPAPWVPPKAAGAWSDMSKRTEFPASVSDCAALRAREVFLSIPYFDGLHRFLPALVRREGFDIAYVDVIDRPRHSGVSNYGFFDRLWIGIMDLAGVWWLIRRKRPTPVATEVF